MSAPLDTTLDVYTLWRSSPDYVAPGREDAVDDEDRWLDTASDAEILAAVAARVLRRERERKAAAAPTFTLVRCPFCAGSCAIGGYTCGFCEASGVVTAETEAEARGVW